MTPGSLRHVLLNGTVLAATLFPMMAHAQSSSETSAQAAETGLGDIVVTAQRRSERLRDVPISIIAQSQDDLIEQGVVKTSDLTVAVPGLTMSTSGAWGLPALRGVQTSISTAGADNPIALYLDGIYRPNQVTNVFELADVERIEVLKGPQGTLFGRNATGGAIVIHTIKPSFDSIKGKISVTDGLYFGSGVKTSNEIGVKGFINIPLGETLAFGASGYYIRNAGYYTNDLTGGRFGRARSFAARGKLYFEPSDKANFLISVMYGETSDDNRQTHLPHGPNIASLFPDAVIPSKPWHTAGEMGGGTHITADDFVASFTGEIELGSAGSLKALTAYSRVHPIVFGDVDSAYSPLCVAAFACITPYAATYGPQKTFQQELTFTSQKFGMFSFIAGAFYYNDRHYAVNNINMAIGPAPDYEIDPEGPGIFINRHNVKTKAYAGFGEMNVDFTDKLRLIAGMRYSWEKKVGVGAFFNAPQTEFSRGSWGSWTPRVSLVYAVDPSTNLYATYSKGFKSGILPAAVLGPIPLNPETLTSYEVGIKIGNRAISAEASFFYYDYKDIQIQFFDGIGNVFANAANSEIYGMDANVVTLLTNELKLRVGGSWMPRAKYVNFPGAVAYDVPLTPTGITQYVVDASGRRMLRAPKLTATATLSYSADIAWGKLDASGTVYYSSAYDYDVRSVVRTKSYAILNGRIALTPVNSRFQFSIFGRNLTNKAYIDGEISSNEGNTVHIAPPRQVGIGIDYAF
jgi:iron complex outermembrane receptor protein